MKIRNRFHLSAAFFSVILSSPISSVCAAEYLGTWDLRGNGQLDAVFRDVNVLRVVQGNGGTSEYTFGNSLWSFVGASDTDGQAGAELVVRAGGSLFVVDQKVRKKREYSVGNIAWAVMRMHNVNSMPGNEILLSIGNGVKVINDSARDVRNITFGYKGSWALFDVVDMHPNDAGPVLVLNIGNGVKLINPRSGAQRDLTFPGYSQITAVAEVDGVPGLEVVGRTGSEVYVVSGGVASGGKRLFSAGTGAAWAIYEKIVDTDGKAGNDIILVKVDGVGVVHPASGGISHYSIPRGVASIQGTSNMDGQPGDEIIARNPVNQTFIINDRLGQVQ
ncbi:hypothetical protein [Pseudomonas citronellolis]|uniref:hypothetical protein n=1 Tax=Pseudomonas citronellolis TaxID=53408 RepID=UPI000A3FAB5E|nr:hypothetical protein [Pseudomonas citronellolis]